MAIQTFADTTTSDIYHGINSKHARRIPQRVWTAAQRKMTLLHNAKSTHDLSLPGLGLEALKYTKPGYHSIRVNDQYRILFVFKMRATQPKNALPEGDAYDVQIADYHGR